MRRSIETIVCFVETALVFKGKTKIINGLAVVGIRIAFLQNFYCLFKIFLSNIKTPFSYVPESEGIVATNVIRIASQTFLVVVNRRIGGMAILL